RCTPERGDPVPDPPPRPASPESTVRAGWSAASLGLSRPPEDCIIRQLVFMPAAVRPCSSRWIYPVILGETYALIAAVELRSYSRISAEILVAATTCEATPASWTTATARCSCSGFT